MVNIRLTTAKRRPHGTGTFRYSRIPAAVLALPEAAAGLRKTTLFAHALERPPPQALVGSATEQPRDFLSQSPGRPDAVVRGTQKWAKPAVAASVFDRRYG